MFLKDFCLEDTVVARNVFFYPTSSEETISLRRRAKNFDLLLWLAESLHQAIREVHVAAWNPNSIVVGDSLVDYWVEDAGFILSKSIIGHLKVELTITNGKM